MKQTLEALPLSAYSSITGCFLGGELDTKQPASAISSEGSYSMQNSLAKSFASNNQARNLARQIEIGDQLTKQKNAVLDSVYLQYQTRKQMTNNTITQSIASNMILGGSQHSSVQSQRLRQQAQSLPQAKIETKRTKTACSTQSSIQKFSSHLIMKNIDEELQDESIELNECSKDIIPKIQFTNNELASSQMRVSLVPLSGSFGAPSSAFKGKSLAIQ